MLLCVSDPRFASFAIILLTYHLLPPHSKTLLMCLHHLFLLATPCPIQLPLTHGLISYFLASFQHYLQPVCSSPASHCWYQGMKFYHILKSYFKTHIPNTTQNHIVSLDVHIWFNGLTLMKGCWPWISDFFPCTTSIPLEQKLGGSICTPSAPQDSY